MGFNALQSIYRVIPGTGQDISSTASPAHNANPFQANTRILRITCSQTVRYRVGLNAVAVATDARLPSGAVEYVGVAPGERLSVIRESDDGVVNVSECSR